MKNHLKQGNKKVKNNDFPRILKNLFADKSAFSASRIVSSFNWSG
jgi:hypothetical protein